MAIEIKDLSKLFGGDKQALKNVSMSFPSNEITGLIGFNGSGKTTTFNILSNFIEKYEGSFTFDGKKLNREILNSISYLAAGDDPKNSTKVLTHLWGIASLYGVKKVDAINKIRLISKEIDFTEFLNKPIKSLSKGNQQKVKIIGSLLNPKLKYLFLDEPFDGLDPIMVNKTKKLYTNLKDITIIITSHRMEVVQSMCKSFFVLKDGVLVNAKETSEKVVVLRVNKAVSIDEVKKMECVVSTKTIDDEHEIIIDDIKNFKVVNKELINSKNYIYSGLKEENIAETVFREYE